jgi:hypothetical protein
LLPTPFSFLLCFSRPKTCIISMMAVPHQQEQNEPHSYPSTEGGGGAFLVQQSAPFIGCHLHIQATSQRHANVYYRQMQFTLQWPRLRTTKVCSHCCKHTIQTQNWTHYLRHSLSLSLCTPASQSSTSLIASPRNHRFTCKTMHKPHLVHLYTYF